jgi:hypothetical protein
MLPISNTPHTPFSDLVAGPTRTREPNLCGQVCAGQVCSVLLGIAISRRHFEGNDVPPAVSIQCIGFLAMAMLKSPRL